jgi:PhnB protein
MKSATPYLHFDGNCRQAMTFYKDCLGGELQFVPYPDNAGQTPADESATLMHSQITVNGQAIVQASDSAPGGVPQPGDNFSISIECDSARELERLFSALGQGGELRLPPNDMPWGARFGMLTDRFGIQWMFSYTFADKN